MHKPQYNNDNPRYRVACAEDYDTAHVGMFVVEELNYWNSYCPRYARPDFVERGTPELGRLFPTREAAEAAIAAHCCD